MNEEFIDSMINNEEFDESDDYDYCPNCGVKYDEHPKDYDGEYECNTRLLIEQKIRRDDPGFVITDLGKYNSDFVRKIAVWQGQKITFLDMVIKDLKEEIEKLKKEVKNV